MCVPRQPQVCVTAGQLAVTLEAKTKYSAKLVYEWANDATGEQRPVTTLPEDLAGFDNIQTGSRPSHSLVRQSQSTLRLEDLIPEWSAPRKG
jgi:Family of unknown function (DUF5330)